jgi:hypothetical protein
MKNIVQKIAIISMAGFALTGCGGGNSGSSGSNIDYAPINASAFETKFLDQTIAVVSSSNRITIKRDKKSDHVIATKSKSGTYSYVHVSKNKAETRHTINDNRGTSCVYTWTFTAELKGNMIEHCKDQNNTEQNSTGQFTISGKN